MLEQLGNQNSKRQAQKTTLFLFGQQNYYLCHCLYCPHLIGHLQCRLTRVNWLTFTRDESTCNAGDPSPIPGSGRSTGEGMGYPHQYSWASLVAQLVKNLPAMWETWAWSLGWEDPLEKGKATHYSILAWRFHGLCSSWGHKESDTTERLSLTHISTWLLEKP